MPSATESAWTLALANSPEHVDRLAVISAPELIDPAWIVCDQLQAACDDIRLSQLLPGGVRIDRIDHAIVGADLVWVKYPGSLAGLDEAAEYTANQGADDVRLVVIARNAELTHSMNDVLARHFTRFWASRGVGKSRALIAEGPIRPNRLRWPRARHVAELDLDVWAHGVTFAGGRLDPGTRALVARLDEVPRGDVLDFGSGSGILATLLARRDNQPPERVTAIDVRATSVDSTRRTAASAGAPVTAIWADGIGDVARESLDAIVTNPPFHQGTAKDSSDTLAMFAQAPRVLRPGGQLWVVYNSHLPWKARLSELVGSTRLINQDPRYTVVCATRR
jgi:16S rRNA (guanine1207-N2)-methyltransferase